MIMRSADRSCVSRGAGRASTAASRNFAEVPKWVNFSFSAKSNRILPLRANGEPS
jgi:hypothetical protein